MIGHKLCISQNSPTCACAWIMFHVDSSVRCKQNQR